MRLERIAVRNLLSFDDFVWDDPNPGSNLIVGPNGSGKTNFVHALRAVIDVLSSFEVGGDSRARWEAAGHAGFEGEPTEIALDLRFTDPLETNLLSAFYAASLCSEPLTMINSETFSTEQRGRLSMCFSRQVSPEHTSLIQLGRLVVRHDGAGHWRCWYESLPNERPFWWGLWGSGVVGISATEEDRSGRQLHDALYAALGREATAAFLAGDTSQLRLPTLEELLQTGPGAVAVEVRRPVRSYLTTHGDLEQMLDEKLVENRSYGPLFLIRHLLGHRLVVTENVRSLPRRRFTVEESTEAIADLASGRDVGLALYRMKNGAPAEGARYRLAQENFRALTGRFAFDVKMDMRTRATRRANDDPVSVDLAIVVGRDGEEPARPIEFSGAGMAEALLLATILASEPGSIVILDEPAANLHPTIQRRLARRIEATTGCQFFVITHSAELILPETITQTSRFALAHGETRRTTLGEFHDVHTRARAEQALRRSADSRALLFARAALLVEGETEFGALPLWLEQVRTERSEADDVVVYWAGGDGSFETLIRILNAFDVPWAVICDGNAIADASAKGIAAQLHRSGVLESEPGAGATFDQRRELLGSAGVFTLAHGPQDNFESLPLIVENATDARRRVGKSKARTARIIAEEHPCPAEVSVLLAHALEHCRR